MSSFSNNLEPKKNKKFNKNFFNDLIKLLKNSFENLIFLHLYPKTSIKIFLQVLQFDGSLIQTSINAITLALISSGILIKDYLIGITLANISNSSFNNNNYLIDLTNFEQNDLPNLTVAVLPRTKKISLIHLDSRINIDNFQSSLQIAIDAALVLQVELDREVRRWSAELDASFHDPIIYKSIQPTGLVAQQNPHLLIDQEMN
ncbi:hypothetical protein O181_110951 [Austropuccinia psidii MF-1]|uniref:Exoribonuclease phosphorolytic domain-containing protein n=1 Tax=Austropuccinia psidii MF-1 TaxID=1389203 RepID=A0A9Q3PS98_9BASI|nr:hypothetical protein [Austropuccinia psidii MF-1]